MATTDVAICNDALSHVGVDLIVSLDDDSRQAKICKEKYPNVKKRILRSHPWNCATRRVLLALSSEAPAFGYTYKYPVPLDFLRALSFNEDIYAWELEGRDIVTDAPEAQLKYIADVGEEYIDPLLAAAIAVQLAAEIAPDLNPEKTAYLEQKSINDMRTARAIDAQESSAKATVNNTFKRARR